MNKSDYILETFFGDNNEDGGSFVYKLKQSCDVVNIVINDRSNCWDVIAYNRFFYDNEDELDIYYETLIR